MSFKILIKALHWTGMIIKLRLHGITHGRRIRGNRVVVRNFGKIIIGNAVSLNSFPDGNPHRTILMAHCREAVISIGDNCNLNGTAIHCRKEVTIGNFCMFGPGVHLIDNDSHRITADIGERRQPPRSAPIIIRDNVWIGMNSLILKGVEVGENAVVAAHSVVVRSVPENSLVAGNPARVVKRLTSDVCEYKT